MCCQSTKCALSHSATYMEGIMTEYHATKKLRWVHKTLRQDVVVPILQRWWSIEPIEYEHYEFVGPEWCDCKQGGEWRDLTWRG